MRLGLCSVLGITWRDFWQNTSIGGASNSSNAKETWRKVFWLIVFLVGTAATVWAVMLVIQDYQKYPVNTASSLRRFSKISFPSVTICNQNRVSCHRLLQVRDTCNNATAICPLTTPNGTEIINKLFEKACIQPSSRKKRSPLLSSGGGGLLGGITATTLILTTSSTQPGSSSPLTTSSNPAPALFDTDSSTFTVTVTDPKVLVATESSLSVTSSSIIPPVVSTSLSNALPDISTPIVTEPQAVSVGLDNVGVTPTTSLIISNTIPGLVDVSTLAEVATIQSSSPALVNLTNMQLCPSLEPSCNTSAIGSNLTDVISNSVDTLGSVVDSAGSALSNTTDLSGTLLNTTTDLTNTLGEAINETLDTSSITNVIDSLANLTDAVLNDTTNSLGPVLTSVTNITDTTNTILNTATNLTTGLVSNISNTLNSTVGGVTDLTDTVLGTVTNVTTAVGGDTLGSVVGSVTDLTNSVVGSVVNVTTDLTGGSDNATPSAIGIEYSTPAGTVTKTLSPSGNPELDTLGSVPEKVNEEYRFLSAFTSLSEQDRKLIGVDFSSFIKECTFRQRDCTSQDNFLVFATPTFGNCFIFNSAMNDKDIFGGKRITSMSGPSFGLELTLDLNQEEYMKNGQTQPAGAKLVVHRSDAVPLTDDFGIDIHPNTLTKVAAQEVSITRLTHPYPSNCTSDWSRTNYSDYVPRDRLGWNYTLSLCSRFCMMSSFIQECNCFHPLLTDSDESRKNVGPCDLVAGTNDSSCVNQIITELDDGIRTCGCQVDCEEKSYELSVSESQWPGEQYMDEAEQDFNQNSNASSGFSPEKNLLKVQVYFTSLNVQLLTESRVYSWEDSSLISAFGGALSLYLGISIIMIFEVLEFILNFFINCYRYIIRGRAPPKQEAEDANDDIPQAFASSSYAPYSKGFSYKSP